MHLLSTEEISTLCENIVSVAEKHDLFLHAVFDTLNLTGLRCNEALEFERWTILTDNLFQVTTEKKSSPRLFNAEELNPLYSDLLKNDATYLLTHNYKSVARKFKLFCPYSNLVVGNKQISTHLFRHNYVKKLFNQGQSIQQISDKIGEKEPKNILGYVNSQIMGSSFVAASNS